MDEDLKNGSKFKIEKMKTDFFLETPIKNIEVNVCNVVVSNKKNGEIKTMKILKKNKKIL